MKLQMLLAVVGIVLIYRSEQQQLSVAQQLQGTAQLHAMLTGEGYKKSLIPASTCKQHTPSLHNNSSVAHTNGTVAINKPCPFIVQARLFLIRIQDLIENQETLVTTIRVQLGWTDPALQCNPSRFNGINSIVIPGGDIWVPDLQFANSVDDMYALMSTNEFGFRLTNDGKVWWHPTGKVSTRCQIDLTYYPFDFQRCSVVIESVIYTVNELELIVRTDKPDPVALGMYTENKLWKLVNVTGYPVLYKSGPNTIFSRVHFWFLLQREPSYYRDTFLIPTALLAVIQVMTYLIPMHHVDRVPQATVVLLAAFVLQSTISDRLPRSPQQSLVQTYLNIIVGVSVATIGICVITIEMMDPDEELEWWGILHLRRISKRRTKKPAATTNGFEKKMMESNKQEKERLKTTLAACYVNLFGFIGCCLVTVIYPVWAFYGYVVSTPPILPPPPPNNITLSYYAELPVGH